MIRSIVGLIRAIVGRNSVRVDQILRDPRERDTLNYLVDELGTTRYRAARIIQAAHRKR